MQTKLFPVANQITTIFAKWIELTRCEKHTTELPGVSLNGIENGRMVPFGEREEILAVARSKKFAVKYQWTICIRREVIPC